MSTIVDAELLLAFGGALHVAAGLLAGPALLVRGLAAARAEDAEHGREQEDGFFRHGKDYDLL